MREIAFGQREHIHLHLREVVDVVSRTAPKELRRKFPMELEQFGSGYTEQQSLFSAA